MTGFAARTASSRRRGRSKKRNAVLRGSTSMRFRFIEEHQNSFQTARLCRVMDVSERGLRAFRSRPASPQVSGLTWSLWRISKNNHGSPPGQLRPPQNDGGAEGTGSEYRPSPRRTLDTGERHICGENAEAATSRRTAITPSTSRPIFWTATSMPPAQIRNGQAISALSGPRRAGCTSP